MLRHLPAFALIATLTAAHAKPIPNLKFHDLTGHDLRLNDLRGSITVISFWATWCTPCREELPRLSTLQQKYSASHVRFVAISVDDPKDFAKIVPFFHQQNIKLDVWVGADFDTLDRLGLSNVVPATLIIDSNGEVVGRISGEARDSDVTVYLDWLLHGRNDPPPDPFIKRF